MASPGIWEQLDTEGTETTGFVRLRINAVHACRLYAARSIATGLEAIMLDVEKASIPARRQLPHTRGFDLRTVALDPGRGGRSLLVLNLLEDRYRDVFAALSADTIAHLAECASEQEAVQQLFARLARWQAFLQQHDPEGLSLPEQQGLFGELAILRRLIDLGVGPTTAVESWQGPKGASHDFRLASGSVEVKTTTAVTPVTIRISNVRQLDDTGVPALLLVVLVLDEAEAGQSLTSIVEEIAQRLPDTATNTWTDRLNAAGYLDIQRHLYESPGYLVRDLRTYSVAPGFPRLLEADLTEGVSDVRYAVSLAALKNFRCEGLETITTSITSDA